MARHNLSEAGRLRCAQSGSLNLQRWRAGEQLPSDIEQEVALFRARLEAEASRTLPASAREALIRNACVLFMKLSLIDRQLLRQSHLSARSPLKGDDLAPVSSNLLRTLRALGLIDGAADGESEAQSPSEWLARQASAGSE